MKKVYFFVLMVVITMNVSAQIIITGAMQNPTGDDYTGGYGYEYVQFMATEDINNASNFCIVLARNSSNAHTGWINPTTTNSYKINISNLTAAKGTFFYLVGMDPQLDGASSTAFPVEANLIKFDQSQDGADGQGVAVTSSTGFFPNTHPAGIAVFNTQSPTSTTRPIDAIFFGEATDTGLGANKLYVSNPTPPEGYTVPTYDNGNDVLYFDVNSADGNSLYLPAGATAGRFYKFVGEYNTDTKKWTTVRVIGTKTNPTNLAGLESPGTTLTDNSTLPIQLSSFTAKAANHGIQLNWVTASEKDNARFDIYRSASVGDDFRLIGSVSGKGTTNETSIYNYIDNSPFAGINYYKLVQVDNNGKETPSDVVFAKTALQPESIRVSVASGGVNVSVYSATGGNGALYLYDITGRQLQYSNVQLEKGYTALTLPVSLQKGVYIVALKAGTDNTRTKFVY